MKRVIAAVLVATLALACGQGAATDTPTPAPSPSPSAISSLATPTAAISPTPEATEEPIPSLFFERVEDVRGTAELYAVTAFEGGFVAGGCRLRPPSAGSEGGCASAYALISRDGASWSEAPLPGGSDVTIVGLADTPLGVMAFGSTLRSEPPQGRTIWRLGADEQWERLSMPAPSSIVFRTAAHVNGRTVFLGSDTAFDLAVETEIWSTADGASWSSGSSPLSPKVAAAPGLVAVGDECVDVCEPVVLTRVFGSADGMTWTEQSVPSALASTSVEALAAWKGRAILGGSLAVGSESRAVVWLDSPVGWRQVTLADGAGWAVSSLIVSPQGVIAVGQPAGDGPPATWWSQDGVAWAPVPLEGIGYGYIAASAAGSQLVVIVNYDSIWVSAF